MRRHLGLSLVLAAGCLDVNPIFVEPQASGGATEGGETTGGDLTTTPPTTTTTMTTMTTMTTPPTTDDGGVTTSETTDSPDTEGSTTMPPGACGDGVQNPGEECDDGNMADDDTCLSECKSATCGDGVVWAGKEACDDGNAVETDACLSTCAQATCGDKVVWMGEEECDDGNAEGNDGCEPVVCLKTAKVVFVSSVVVTGDMGGIQGAHALCATLAMQANLPPAPYLAWISDSKTSPDMFMKKSNYPYIKVNKEVVAMNWQKLTSEDLLSPIDLDEKGNPAPALPETPCGTHGVHTSTPPSGAKGDPMTNCNDWTSAIGYADWGDSSATSATKWSLGCGYELNCAYEVPIYCVQQ